MARASKFPLACFIQPSNHGRPEPCDRVRPSRLSSSARAAVEKSGDLASSIIGRSYSVTASIDAIS